MCLQLEGDLGKRNNKGLINILDSGNNYSECYGDKGKATSLCWNLRGLELLSGCKSKAHLHGCMLRVTCVWYLWMHICVLYKVKYCSSMIWISFTKVWLYWGWFHKFWSKVSFFYDLIFYQAVGGKIFVKTIPVWVEILVLEGWLVEWKELWIG